MRQAFSLVTALFVMVAMGMVAALVFNLSGKMVQSTTFQFRHEQAALLAKSYTELALMAIINYDRTANDKCIENIDGVVSTVDIGATPPATATSTNGEAYEVETRIYYIGNHLTHCSASRWLNSTTTIQTDYNTTSTAPLHDDEVAAVIIDVYVRYKDPDMYAAYLEAHGGTAPTATQIPWITYHKRTLQKI